MPLPFNNHHSGKRQFQCFCCGIIIESFDKFKEHVMQSHELAKDYILCPLKRCNAPIRCVRSHFKACHKHEEIPNTCQMKALVWRDPKDPSKKKKKVSFKEGYFVSAKNKNKKIHYRSSWELEVYETLEKNNDVVNYEVESIQVEYFFEGERHTYFPDIKVYYTDGQVDVWEIKPSSQTNLKAFPVNEAKWMYCNEYCKLRGWNFKIVTETGLGKLKKGIRI